MNRIAELMAADPTIGSAAGDELELLAHLVEDYETKHHDIGLPSPLQAILFRMEQQNLRPKDLIPYLGSASRVSEVLGGKRTLSLEMVRKLNDGLGIPAEVLLQEQRKRAVDDPPARLPPAVAKLHAGEQTAFCILPCFIFVLERSRQPRYHKASFAIRDRFLRGPVPLVIPSILGAEYDSSNDPIRLLIHSVPSPCRIEP